MVNILIFRTDKIGDLIVTIPAILTIKKYFGEIDITARSADELIFCEVKTRRQGALTAPQEAVTRTKQRRLIKTAGWYLNHHPWDGDLRFDVIAIIARETGFAIIEIEWFQDAFPGEL